MAKLEAKAVQTAENKAVQTAENKAADELVVEDQAPPLTAWLRNNVDAGNITLEEARARMAAHVAK